MDKQTWFRSLPLRKYSEDEISEKISLERYKAFVENISEGVYEVDIHGKFCLL